MCLAAVGFAAIARWRCDFASETASESCRDGVSGCGSKACQDGVPECASKKPQHKGLENSGLFCEKKNTARYLEFRIHHYFDLCLFTISNPTGSLACSANFADEKRRQKRPLLTFIIKAFALWNFRCMKMRQTAAACSKLQQNHQTSGADKKNRNENECCVQNNKWKRAA